MKETKPKNGAERALEDDYQLLVGVHSFLLS